MFMRSTIRSTVASLNVNITLFLLLLLLSCIGATAYQCKDTTVDTPLRITATDYEHDITRLISIHNCIFTAGVTIIGSSDPSLTSSLSISIEGSRFETQGGDYNSLSISGFDYDSSDASSNSVTSPATTDGSSNINNKVGLSIRHCVFDGTGISMKSLTLSGDDSHLTTANDDGDGGDPDAVSANSSNNNSPVLEIQNTTITPRVTSQGMAIQLQQSTIKSGGQVRFHNVHIANSASHGVRLDSCTFSGGVFSLFNSHLFGTVRAFDTMTSTMTNASRFSLINSQFRGNSNENFFLATSRSTRFENSALLLQNCTVGHQIIVNFNAGHHSSLKLFDAHDSVKIEGLSNRELGLFFQVALQSNPDIPPRYNVHLQWIEVDLTTLLVPQQIEDLNLPQPIFFLAVAHELPAVGTFAASMYGLKNMGIVDNGKTVVAGTVASAVQLENWWVLGTHHVGLGVVNSTQKSSQQSSPPQELPELRIRGLTARGIDVLSARFVTATSRQSANSSVTLGKNTIHILEVASITQLTSSSEVQQPPGRMIIEKSTAEATGLLIDGTPFEGSQSFVKIDDVSLRSMSESAIRLRDTPFRNGSLCSINKFTRVGTTVGELEFTGSTADFYSGDKGSAFFNHSTLCIRNSVFVTSDRAMTYEMPSGSDVVLFNTNVNIANTKFTKLNFFIRSWATYGGSVNIFNTTWTTFTASFATGGGATRYTLTQCTGPFIIHYQYLQQWMAFTQPTGGMESQKLYNAAAFVVSLLGEDSELHQHGGRSEREQVYVIAPTAGRSLQLENVVVASRHGISGAFSGEVKLKGTQPLPLTNPTGFSSSGNNICSSSSSSSTVNLVGLVCLPNAARKVLLVQNLTAMHLSVWSITMAAPDIITYIKNVTVSHSIKFVSTAFDNGASLILENVNMWDAVGGLIFSGVGTFLNGATIAMIDVSIAKGISFSGNGIKFDQMRFLLQDSTVAAFATPLLSDKKFENGCEISIINSNFVSQTSGTLFAGAWLEDTVIKLIHVNMGGKTMSLNVAGTTNISCVEMSGLSRLSINWHGRAPATYLSYRPTRTEGVVVNGKATTIYKPFTLQTRASPAFLSSSSNKYPTIDVSLPPHGGYSTELSRLAVAIVSGEWASSIRLNSMDMPTHEAQMEMLATSSGVEDDDNSPSTQDRFLPPPMMVLENITANQIIISSTQFLTRPEYLQHSSSSSSSSDGFALILRNITMTGFKGISFPACSFNAEAFPPSMLIYLNDIDINLVGSGITTTNIAFADSLLTHSKVVLDNVWCGSSSNTGFEIGGQAKMQNSTLIIRNSTFDNRAVALSVATSITKDSLLVLDDVKCAASVSFGGITDVNFLIHETSFKSRPSFTVLGDSSKIYVASSAVLKFFKSDITVHVDEDPRTDVVLEAGITKATTTAAEVEAMIDQYAQARGVFPTNRLFLEWLETKNQLRSMAHEYQRRLASVDDHGAELLGQNHPFLWLQEHVAKQRDNATNSMAQSPTTEFLNELGAFMLRFANVTNSDVIDDIACSWGEQSFVYKPSDKPAAGTDQTPTISAAASSPTHTTSSSLSRMRHQTPTATTWQQSIVSSKSFTSPQTPTVAVEVQGATRSLTLATATEGNVTSPPPATALPPIASPSPQTQQPTSSPPPHPPPPPKRRVDVVIADIIPNEAAAEGVTAGSTASSVVTAIVAPTSASNMVRVGAALRTINCAISGDDDEVPSVLEHPFSPPIGSGPYRYFTGGVLVSSLLVSTLFISTVALRSQLRRDNDSDGQKHPPSLTNATKGAGIATCITLIYLGPSIVGTAITVVIHADSSRDDGGDPSQRSIGVIGLVAVGIVTGYLCWILNGGGVSRTKSRGDGSTTTTTTTRSDDDDGDSSSKSPTSQSESSSDDEESDELGAALLAVKDEKERTETTSSSSVESAAQIEADRKAALRRRSRKLQNGRPVSGVILGIPTEGSAVMGNLKFDFENLEENSGFTEAWFALFEATRNIDNKWTRNYFFVEMLATCTLSLLAGIRPEDPDKCINIATTSALVAILHLIYLVVIHPYRTRLDTIFTIFFGGVQVLLCVFCILATRNEDKYLPYAATCAFVLMLSMIIQTPIQILWAVITANRRKIQVRMMKQQQQQGEQQYNNGTGDVELMVLASGGSGRSSDDSRDDTEEIQSNEGNEKSEGMTSLLVVPERNTTKRKKKQRRQGDGAATVNPLVKEQ